LAPFCSRWGSSPPRDLVAQVKLQVKEIVLKMFNWRDGKYQFDSGVLPVSEIIPSI